MEMLEEHQHRFKTEETLEDIEEEEEEDRISPLPDCLIIQILSRLPSTKDAIRTGTLAKRWKPLWISTPTLIFTHSAHNQLTSDFVSLVNKTLTQCRHSNLDRFTLVFEFDIRFQSQVDNWIRYAISHNVEQLNLNLITFGPRDLCALEDQVFINSCFTDLKLKGFAFNPNGAISWKLLRNLCISDAILEEDVIENILSGSPVLETLVLRDCYGYRRLDITSKSIKNLVFFGYHDPSDDIFLEDVIEINAPNILSLKIQSNLLLWKLLLLEVSSLVEAELDYTKLGYCETPQKDAKEEMLKGFIQSLRHVKELKVGSCCAMALSRLEAKGFLFPSNMKFPDVTSSPWSDDRD